MATRFLIEAPSCPFGRSGRLAAPEPLRTTGRRMLAVARVPVGAVRWIAASSDGVGLQAWTGEQGGGNRVRMMLPGRGGRAASAVTPLHCRQARRHDLLPKDLGLADGGQFDVGTV
jgi:hypothetical protein